MNRQEAARLVAVVFAACPAQSSKLDQQRQLAMVDAFASLLEDLSYEQANAAVRALLQTRSWMPSVADIRATALELERGPVAAGGEQWGTVLRAMREQGAYREPGVDFVFHDAVTAKCVQSMGWRELCLSENTVADRARFTDLYDKLAQQSHREALSPALAAAKLRREIPAATSGDEASALVLQLAAAKRVGT
jgi:Loader and inhibitor of phage G40P